MGSPNNGPFSYVSGSLQLYAEALNYHRDLSKIISSESHSNKNIFIKNINKIPVTTRNEVKKFIKRTSSKYKDFKYEIYSNGLHVISAINPGKVLNSYAIYTKILYKDGTIRASFKDTVDNTGRNIHRHIKYPMKEK